MRVFCVTNLKGGTGKTTTSVFLAHALAAAGRSVMLVDADPQGSALRWSEQTDWTVVPVGLPTKRIHQQLSGIVPATIDAVVIDTPPLEEQAGIVLSAMRAASDVVVTVAPTMMELDRLPQVWAALDDVEPLRESDATVSVLLNRTVANASSTGVARQILTESGRHVLATDVPRLETYAQAFGASVPVTPHFSEIASELLERPTVVAA